MLLLLLQRWPVYFLLSRPCRILTTCFHLKHPNAFIAPSFAHPHRQAEDRTAERKTTQPQLQGAHLSLLSHCLNCTGWFCSPALTRSSHLRYFWKTERCVRRWIAGTVVLVHLVNERLIRTGVCRVSLPVRAVNTLGTATLLDICMRGS